MVVPNTPALVVELVLGCLSILLIARGMLNFWRLRQTHNRHTIFVYTMIGLWWVGKLENIKRL